MDRWIRSPMGQGKEESEDSEGSRSYVELQSRECRYQSRLNKERNLVDTYQQFQVADILTQRTDGTPDPGVINLNDNPSVWPPIPLTPLFNPLPPVAGLSGSTDCGCPLVRGDAVCKEQISARLKVAPYPPTHFSGSQPTSEESSPINSQPSSQG
ncbi:hypothetical protein BDW22DRAFT_1433502 [Trametopsis cervina]|nr:hypothetical protein BDW22DRAFT_1433502 [Trametopsis cervina]